MMGGGRRFETDRQHLKSVLGLDIDKFIQDIVQRLKAEELPFYHQEKVPEQNWGLHGYTLYFLLLLKNIDCGYSLEPPRRGGSNEYSQSMF